MATTSGVENINMSNWQTATRNVANKSTSGTTLEMEDFFKLLAAQLKYQDMDNPMETSEMMQQMVQMQMVNSISLMNQMSYITYASSMVGKTVTIAGMDSSGNYTGDYIVGEVEGVNVSANPPKLIVGSGSYDITQLVTIGAPKELLNPPEEDKNDGTQSGGDTETETGTDKVEGQSGGQI